MQSIVDDLFLVVDRGSVVFESRSISAAQVKLSNLGRGVLCKVLCCDITDFVRQNTAPQKRKRKTGLNGGR